MKILLRKLQTRNAAILPQLDERQRRLFAASEARAAGHGGIAAVSRVTRIAASTIGRGLKELDAPAPLKPGGVRGPGGGRKSLTEADPGLLDDLNALVEPDARGDPMSPLRWTCKSLRSAGRGTRQRSGTRSATRWSASCSKKPEVQPASQSQDARGRRQSGPRRAIRRTSTTAVKTAMAENQPADLGRYEEEGAGRRLQERRTRVAQAQGQPEEVRVHDFA